MGSQKASVEFEVEHIPQAMMEARRWLAWRPVERDGKWTKVPIEAATGDPGSSTDPATWTDFNTAINAATDNGWGIGFALGDGWLGIDFDHVTEDKAFYDEVMALCHRQRTYAEESVSGTGVHMILRDASIPEWSQNRRGPVEIYQSGRYFTVSGKALHYGLDCTDAQDIVDEVCNRYLRRHHPAPVTNVAPVTGALPSDPSADDFAYSCDLARKGLRQHEVEELLRSRMEGQGRAEKAARPDYVPRTVAAAIAKVGVVEPEMKPAAPRALGDILEEHVEKTPYVIDQILRRGEVAALIAPPKCRKSFLVADLALACAEGRRWFGQWLMTKGRALLVDNELSENEISDRMRAIMEATNCSPASIAGRLDVLSLRESEQSLDHVLGSLKGLENPYDLVIFDALYMFLEKGMDENGNADMTYLLRKFRRFASASGAACVLVHHTSKGVQATKDPIDLGAGAGALGRAVDSNIGIFRHSIDDHFVMKFTLRSSQPVGPLGMKWSYPCFSSITGGVDLEDLYTGPAKKKRSDD